MYVEKKTAVTTLQSAWRCFCVHSDFVAMTKASIIIQTATRRMQTNRTYCASIRAIISVQRMIRQSHARRELLRRRCQRFASMTMAAVKIQSCYRRRMAEYVLCCAIRACIMIQSSMRAHKARAAFAMSRAAAIKLQSFTRTHSARTMYAEKKTAVTTLQSAWNYYNKRKRFMIRIAAAIKIQSVFFRGFHQRSLFKSIMRKRQNSAIRLQTSIRKHVQRIAFLHAKRAAIQVQIASRGFLARLSFRSMRSALVIQRTARKWIAIVMLSNVRSAVASLQAKVRGMQAKSRYRALQEISNKIGSLQRGRVARRQFHAFRCAVLSLQTAFRRRLARLVLVQRRADYYYALAHASRIMQSACKIQRTFKKYSWRQRRVWAAKIIQRKAKLYLMMLRASLIKSKLEKLQSFWRGCIARSRVHSNKKLTEMRARVARANVNAREDMTLGHRTKAALCVLLSSKNLSEVFSAIKTLEMSTRWSSTCCSCFVGEASEALPIMYGLIRSCNRSQPHRKLLVHALRVLSNVWPYEIALTTGGNTSSQRRLVPALTPRMEILVDLMQVRIAHF